MKEQFYADGFDIVPMDSMAEVCVINSCTVTADGDRKTKQAARRARAANETAVIAVTGCFPQTSPEDIGELLPEADIIMGTKNRARLAEHCKTVLSAGGRIVDIEKHSKDDKFERADFRRFSERTRAFVKIEDGCDRMCAYCIIPKARGSVRSKPISEIKDEMVNLAEAGHREVVLSGINLSSYGRDINSSLVEAVETASGSMARVRLGSLEPELITDGDLDKLAKINGFCPQFHLSLQSGSDSVLKRMKRRYTSGDYAELAAKMRAKFQNAAITTDIMVGFPGETDEEFEETMRFVRTIGFAKVHVFSYSKRQGTAAASMDEQVSEPVKKERNKKLSELCALERERYIKSCAGKTFTVLTEESGAGYTENYIKVKLPPTAKKNELVRVILGDYDKEADICTAEMI